MKLKAGVISLGCSKNRVDSEHILAALRDAGFGLTGDIGEADAIVINTCGFITPAKEESINTILETARDKKPGALTVVCGCLAQRYPDELRAELPEIDVLHGVGDYSGLIGKICARLGLEAPRECGGRVLTTPPYSAYLRIADGCDNRCAYCAIPLIRGGRKSVPMEELERETRALAGGGASEITLIAQDTSAYGADIYGKPMLPELLKRLSPIEGIHWLRVLYAYPNTVTHELVDTMLSLPNVARYIDMPIQHIDPDMLERMNRHGSAEHIREITDYIRSASDDFILRTTVMTGFPGETGEAFEELASFLGEHPFDRVGAFAFSAEDGTPAAKMDDQVDEDVARGRLERIMTMQRRISLELNRRRIGRSCELLVTARDGDTVSGRSYAEAPEVDGMIAVSGASRTVSPGEYIRIKITGASPYDLKGECE